MIFIYSGIIAVLAVAILLFSIVFIKGCIHDEEYDLDPHYSEEAYHYLELLQKWYQNNPGFERIYFNKFRKVMQDSHGLYYYKDYLIAKVGDEIGVFAITSEAQQVVGGMIYKYSYFKNITYNTIATLG